METATVKKDVYQIVTERIIEQLQQNKVPWQKPWTEAGVPQNLITRRPYRGINVMLLALQDYPLNYFLTFKQLKELGGTVIKGEKAHIVVFWKWVDEENEETGETVKKAFLRYHMVFNIAQCANIPNDKIPVVEKPNNPIMECEEIVKAMQMRPKIVHKEDKAFYHPVMDYVNMPKIKSFKDSASYYGALFHELVHSTGHANRLNRKEVMDSKPYGSESYSIEELTAEIGACYLKSHAGIAMEVENSAAYIQGWLERLKNDKRFIVYASVQAQKAVDYILNTQPEEIASSIKENSSVPA